MQTFTTQLKKRDTIDVEVNAQITHNGKAYPIASLPDNLVDILNAERTC